MHADEYSFMQFCPASSTDSDSQLTLTGVVMSQASELLTLYFTVILSHRAP